LSQQEVSPPPAQPVLDVEGFVLLPWQPADAPAVVASYRNPGIRQRHVRTMNEKEALAWIDAWPNRWRQERGCGWAAASDHAVLGADQSAHIDVVPAMNCGDSSC
jgi:hypothetical protein